jgi:hypothetical protein
MIDRQSLMDAQQSVVAGLLDEGVKVVFDADAPRADLRERVMHARPLPVEVDEDDLLHLRADTDHELGHFAWSDPDALERSAKRPLLALAHNSIEDGYVERKLSERWFGVAQGLAASNDKMSAEIKASAGDSAESKRERSVLALQFLALGETVEQVCERLGDDLMPSLGEIADLVPSLVAAGSSWETLSAAEAVLTRWRWADKNRGRGKGGKKKDSSAKGSADPVHKPDEKYRKREDRIAKRIAKRASVSEVRKRRIRSMKFEGALVYQPRTDDDVVEHLRVTAGVRAATPGFMRLVRSVAAPLRRRLMMEFRAVGRRTEYAHTAGELDRSALHRVALGQRDVFTREVPTPIVDADVTLLVDVSGSMTKTHDGLSRIFTAAQAAAAFSLVLDHLGIRHECLGFTTAKKVRKELTSLFYAGTYQRVRPLRYLLVKTADQRFRQAQANFVALSCFGPCSENVDGEAVLWASHRMAARARVGRRPFLLVFSDGDPASVPEGQKILAAHLRFALERVERAGIEVLGVGIATNTVSNYYRNHVVIDELTDLVGTSYSLVRKILRSTVGVGRPG